MTHHISEKVARKIKRCAEKQETFLNLRECNLEEIPAEVFELKHLEVLDLGNYKEVRSNLINQIPKEIVKLENLTYLDLHRNIVENLPNEINQLQNLKNLNLEGNRLQGLPSKMDQLVNLTKLNLTEVTHLNLT